MISQFLPFLVLAASASLSFGQAPEIVPLGSEFKLTINLSSGGRQTLGTDTVILFDPKVISATKVRTGKLYPNYPANLTDIDNVYGKVLLSGTVGFGQPQKVEGVLAEVFFRPKKIGPTQISFDWEEGGTADSNIVPDFGGLDLLTEAPKEITLAVREASFGEKVLGLIKRVLPF